MINLKDAAKSLRRSERWLSNQVADGKLAVTRQGRQKLVTEGELARFARAEHLDLPADPVTTRLEAIGRALYELDRRLDTIERRLTNIERAVILEAEGLRMLVKPENLPPT
jgi:hypothetical protein